jgi:ectoine hydroxylase-related dioxygenase (phytanoyl-CoA dioxygenase family)
MKLSQQQIDRFNTEGYMSVDKLISGDDAQQLADHYDKFLRREVSCGDDDRFLGGKTRQVMNPRKYDELFRANNALKIAKEIGRQLLGFEPELQFDMLISKEPGNLNETPWHQDFAYSQMPLRPAGTPIRSERLQFWVALDDVDESNGCMHFVPRAHTGQLLEHFIAGGKETDPGRLLAMTKHPDPSTVVACPLKRGGCTIHTEGTPHYTTGNSTKDRNRRAYIFNLGRPKTA